MNVELSGSAVHSCSFPQALCALQLSSMKPDKACRASTNPSNHADSNDPFDSSNDTRITMTPLNQNIVAGISDWLKQDDFQISHKFFFDKRLDRINLQIVVDLINRSDFNAREVTHTQTALAKIDQLLPKYRQFALSTLLSRFEEKFTQLVAHEKNSQAWISHERLFKHLKIQFNTILQQVVELPHEEQLPLLCELAKWFSGDDTGHHYQRMGDLDLDDFEQIYWASKNLSSREQEVFLASFCSAGDIEYFQKLRRVLEDCQNRLPKDRIDPNVLADMFDAPIHQIGRDEFVTLLNIIKGYPEEERNLLLAPLLLIGLKLSPNMDVVDHILESTSTSSIGKENLFKSLLKFDHQARNYRYNNLRTIICKFSIKEPKEKPDPMIFYRILEGINGFPEEDRAHFLTHLLDACLHLPAEEQPAAMHEIDKAMQHLPESDELYMAKAKRLLQGPGIKPSSSST